MTGELEAFLVLVPIYTFTAPASYSTTTCQQASAHELKTNTPPQKSPNSTLASYGSTRALCDQAACLPTNKSKKVYSALLSHISGFPASADHSQDSPIGIHNRTKNSGTYDKASCAKWSIKRDTTPSRLQKLACTLGPEHRIEMSVCPLEASKSNGIDLPNSLVFPTERRAQRNGIGWEEKRGQGLPRSDVPALV